MKHITLLLILMMILIGCTETAEDDNTSQNTQSQNPDPYKPGQTNPAPSNPGTTQPDGGCMPEKNANYPDLVTDEDWARALIAGKVPADVAFPTISYSCGFPVLTKTKTAIFVHWYKGENWAVAGELTNWEPKPMTESSDHEFWSLEVAQPDNIQTQNHYKFVKNNAEWIADPWSIRFNYDENGEISYLTKPKNEQHMMRWHGFNSPQGLQSRTIYALVPPNEGPYDVLYAHDGQNLFSPEALGGGWKLRENMTKINGNFLIVGIPNTSDRFSEYTHVNDTIEYGGTQHITSKGNEYAAFVEESVRPFIESRFATTQKAGVMGSSLGGLISLYIAHRYPDRYKMVLALSPTTAWGRFGSDNGTLIKDLYMQAGHRSTVLYLDNGGNEPSGGCNKILNSAQANVDESDLDNYCFTRDFVDSMEHIGYAYEKDLHHWFEPNAPHNEGAWADRVFRPLSIFQSL